MAEWQYGGHEKRPSHEGGGVERWAAWVICLAALVTGVWFLFRYALGAVLPFLFAYVLGACIRPLVRRAVGRSCLPRGVVAAVLVILLVGAVTVAISWGVGRAIAELEALLTDNGLGTALTEVADWFRSVSRHLPFLQRFEDTPGFADFCDRLDVAAQEAAQRALTSLGTWLSTVVVGMVTRLPAAVLFITVFLLSCYYVAADDGVMGQAAKWLRERFLPPRWQEAWPSLQTRWRQVLRGYIRAYAILGGVTFALMLIGLSVLGVPYAFLAAGAIALVDVLPVLGSGTVLGPWAAVEFILGETTMGVGLLVLWGASTLLHQVLEPRLIGASLGLHPLLSLLSVYVGLRWFGLGGMLLCPLAAAAVKALIIPPTSGETAENRKMS